MEILVRLSLVLLLAGGDLLGDEPQPAATHSKVQTIGDLVERVRLGLKNGASVVRFPAGQWQWHDLSSLGLKPRVDEPLAKIEIDYSDAGFSKVVKDWVTRSKVKAVQLAFDEKLPAEAFFKIEKILTDLKIPYAISTGSLDGEGKCLILEVDGRARTLVPKEIPEFEDLEVAPQIDSWSEESESGSAGVELPTNPPGSEENQKHEVDHTLSTEIN